MGKRLLAVTAVGIAVVLLLLFGVYILYQSLPVHLTEEIRLTPPAGVFPMAVEGTKLRVLQLSGYTGPFWEDGSDTVVTNAAVLLVENSGDLLAAEGAVILQWGENTMVFELGGLPPGQRMLVIEKDAQQYRQGMPAACYGWCREEYPESMGHVTAVAAPNGGMLVTNHTAARIPAVDVCYKTRDPNSGIYIGGISHTVTVEQLKPGEQRVVRPAHYWQDASRVISVTVWVE